MPLSRIPSRYTAKPGRSLVMSSMIFWKYPGSEEISKGKTFCVILELIKFGYKHQDVGVDDDDFQVKDLL